MVNVYIPTPFRGYVGNRTSVEVEASDVAEVLDTLEARFPGFRNLCCDATGAIPRHINIYVNNKEISALDGTADPAQHRRPGRRHPRDGRRR